MLRTYPREIRLLLACVCLTVDAERIRRHLRPNLNWQAIVGRVEQYGLTPLFYANLTRHTDGGQIPGPILQQLRERSRYHALLNMNRYLKLQSVLQALQQAAIPVVVLKGAALAPLVYQDISHRPMRDVDLLVHKEDVDSADQVLQALHYVPNESSHSQAWYRVHHHHLAPYLAQDGSLSLELHHDIIPPHTSMYIPVDDLWERSRCTQIASMQTRIFAPTDLLLHLCLHVAYTDRFLGKLRDLGDIARIVRRYREEINWSELADHARTYQVEPHLYSTFWLAQEMMGAEIPREVLRDLKISLHWSFWKDISLKFIAKKLVFRHKDTESLAPLWMMNNICAILTQQHSFARNVKDILIMIGKGFCDSAHEIAPEHPCLSKLYTIFMHPFFLLIRTVGRQWSSAQQKTKSH